MDRWLVALSVAFLTLSAGCSGLLGGPATGGGVTSPGGASPTPTDAPVPTATGTPTVTAAGDAYPAGYAASGVTDSRAATRAHVDALTAYDNFTVRYTATVETPEGTTRVAFTQRVDTTRWRVHQASNVSGGSSIERYVTNDTVYVRVRDPAAGETRYSTRATRRTLTAFSGRPVVASVLSNVTYGPGERVERDGRTLLRYEATGPADPRGLLGGRVAPGNVTAFEATVLVDSEGLVRRIDYGATVRRGDGERRLSVSVRVTDLGATTVERPAWVEEAGVGG